MSEPGDTGLLNLAVKASGDKKIEITIDPSKTVAELKQELAEKSGVPADQQRLIYSGRILKDPEELNTYKIKNGSALHLVKSAKPKRDPATSGGSGDAPNSSAASLGSINGAPPPSAMAAGQETGNPLSDLTGARYSGLANLPSASLFGPDGGQGPMPSMADLNSLMLSNPEVLDHAVNLISQSGADENSMLFQSMPAHTREEARALFTSPEMRALMSDPERLRQFLQATLRIQQLMDQSGASQGNGLFGMPQPGDARGDGAASGASASGGAAGGARGAGENPLAALGLGGLGGLGGLEGLGGLGGGDNQSLQNMLRGAFPPTETDTRPPEERYEQQLQQLNELGFFDFDRNVRALRRSGGNIEGAVEALLDGHV